MNPTIAHLGSEASPGRSGKAFQPTQELALETPLLDAAEGIARRLRPSSERALYTLREMPLPVGVPDLLLVALDLKRADDRLASGLPPLESIAQARVAAVAARPRGATLAETAVALGVSPKHAQAVLRKMVRLGYLVEVRGRLRAHPSLKVATTVYALEAKVANWSAGISQSLRYAGYADAVGLVIGQVSERVEVAARSRAEALGVGLYIDRRWVRRPRLHHVGLEHALLTSELILASIVGRGTQGPQVPSATA